MLPAGDIPTKTDHEVMSASATFHSLSEHASSIRSAAAEAPPK
jgi:hypothetical protein